MENITAACFGFAYGSVLAAVSNSYVTYEMAVLNYTWGSSGKLATGWAKSICLEVLTCRASVCMNLLTGEAILLHKTNFNVTSLKYFFFFPIRLTTPTAALILPSHTGGIHSDRFHSTSATYLWILTPIPFTRHFFTKKKKSTRKRYFLHLGSVNTQS